MDGGRGAFQAQKYASSNSGPYVPPSGSVREDTRTWDPLAPQRVLELGGVAALGGGLGYAASGAPGILSGLELGAIGYGAYYAFRWWEQGFFPSVGNIVDPYVTALQEWVFSLFGINGPEWKQWIANSAKEFEMRWGVDIRKELSEYLTLRISEGRSQTPDDFLMYEANKYRYREIQNPDAFNFIFGTTPNEAWTRYRSEYPAGLNLPIWVWVAWCWTNIEAPRFLTAFGVSLQQTMALYKVYPVYAESRDSFGWSKVPILDKSSWVTFTIWVENKYAPPFASPDFKQSFLQHYNITYEVAWKSFIRAYPPTGPDYRSPRDGAYGFLAWARDVYTH
jgi:hypothetical protein